MAIDRSARGFEWLPAAVTAAGLVVLVFVLAVNVRGFTQAVVRWAQGDLDSRAELAARTLEEPLRTQDFKAIRAFADSCRASGMFLEIRSRAGGVVFDSRARDERSIDCLGSDHASGEYLVTVSVPSTLVRAPLYRAVPGFALAGLVGMAGVLLFFLVTYRQRVRIRELKKVEEFRRTFIADVSHEIKTPLTGILGAVEMLGEGSEAKGQGEGEQRNLLFSLIRKEAGRLNGLVQSILDLARLEREGDVLNRSETDLEELAKEVAAKYRCKFDAGSPCVVRCDAQLIGQAVENLVANAVRHAGTDDIRVSVACDDRQARIVVEDHGVGIPPEHAARIFDRFHRVDPARSAETGGAGLGLAIVRRIARLHGGDVTHAPAQPHGAVFTLLIPRCRIGSKTTSVCYNTSHEE